MGDDDDDEGEHGLAKPSQVTARAHLVRSIRLC